MVVKQFDAVRVPPRYVVAYEDDVLYQRVVKERGEDAAAARVDLFMLKREFTTFDQAQRFARSHSAATIYERYNITEYRRDGAQCWQWEEETVADD